MTNYELYSPECDELYSEEYIQNYIEKLRGINYDFFDEYSIY